ncbi:restriction endonuclease subunit S [Vreelandella alkaliphila]|uniref:restriction endonuclease subunit S n=1 Tax=Vreelandella alkaliphila TaxID=272774 RepID=UPI003F97FA0E
MSATHHSRIVGNLFPEGWAVTELGNVVDYGSTQKVELKDVDSDTWVLELEDIEKGTSKLLQRLNTSERAFKSTKNKFEIGDVLYGKLRPYLNKVIVADEDGVCTTEIIPLNAEPNVSNLYLFHWLKSKYFLDYVNEVSYGVNMPRLGTKDAIAAPLVIPPLAEQKVIAEKLDTLLAQVETTKARLECIPRILKTFRQSVLAAAVSGKLSEEWRAARFTLADISDFQNGFAFKSGWFELEGEYQVIKLGNIRDGYLAIENSPAYLNQDVAADYLRFSPEAGDTLISMTGTRFKKDYGFGCLVRNEKNLLVNQRVGRLIPDRSVVLSEFLNIFVRSELFRVQFFTGETGGVNQGNVGSKHIMSINVELPTIEKQTEIVNRVEELFTFADSIEQKAAAALECVNNLTQAILAQAFRGELTADWRAANPDLISAGNSAEALLKKIKTEREALKKQPKKKAAVRIKA